MDVSEVEELLQFLSTPSARRATSSRLASVFFIKFLSTPSARRATCRERLHAGRGEISIHALREEGDWSTVCWPTASPNFYPRPPRGGRRARTSEIQLLFKFLSTPSARRATPITKPCSSKLFVFLSTPSARRATQGRCPDCQPLEFLSTPSARRATNYVFFFPHSFQFLSTPSARRATEAEYLGHEAGRFLSTPSARRATCSHSHFRHRGGISIHALREEGDQRAERGEGLYIEDFYPRPPRGGRLRGQDPESGYCHFYPRPPRGGRQQKQRQNLYFQTNYTTFCTNLEEP